MPFIRIGCWVGFRAGTLPTSLDVFLFDHILTRFTSDRGEGVENTLFVIIIFMAKVITSDKVYIGESKIPDAGRGVFAKTDIKKDEVVERCPIIEVPKNDTSNLNESTLIEYFFFFGKDKKRIALALGFGSIYNHSDKPNATYKVKPKEKVIDFIATKNIKKDKEITFNYRNNQKPEKEKKPLWFEA